MNPITFSYVAPTAANNNGFQTYNVTVTGTYDLSAFGAGGGALTGQAAGGSGAEIGGTFNLTAGQQLQIIVGGIGGNGNNGAGGGGGGFSEILVNSGANGAYVPLLIAGGGGGGVFRSGGGDASVANPNTLGTGGGAGTGQNAADQGTGGGGGAGATTNGTSAAAAGNTAGGQGGMDAANGAAGGSGGGAGGFGGGGGGGRVSGAALGGGGGGGGSTGGNGGNGATRGDPTSGTGGTSYISNAGTLNAAETKAGAGTSTGDGSVRILAPARSATFTITSLNDTATDTSIGTQVGTTGNYQGTLREAINFANQNVGAPGNNGSIVTTINTAAGLAAQTNGAGQTGTIALAGNLPLVATNVTLDGGGLTINGGGAYRGFIVSGIAANGQDAAATTVGISNLNFQGVTATGGAGANGGGGGLGAGGAVFVGPAANVTLSSVGLTNASAVGGAGAASGGNPQGGGGGLSGNGGGPVGNASGGGGGGLLFNGGNSNGTNQGADGGGGGGITSAGGSGTFGSSGQGGGGFNGSTSGGAGGTRGNPGAVGQFGGGGGGGGGNGPADSGGAGGFGGGGGGVGDTGTGGQGGFGGGGGAANFAPGGSGGFGGGGGVGLTNGSSGFGATAAANGTGGNGAGLGGAVFVTAGGTLTINGTTTETGGLAAQGGTNANGATGFGAGIFYEGGPAAAPATLTFGAGNQTIANAIADLNGAAGNATTNNGLGATGGVTALAKNGTGTTTLSGTNTYTGGTTVTGGGTVAVAADANLGAATGGVALNNGTLETTANGFASVRGVTLGAGGGTVQVDTAGNTSTLSGALTNAAGATGALTKTGAGTLTLSGTNNTYSGATTISAGTLRGGATNAFSAASAVTDNATLDLGGNTQTIGALGGSTAGIVTNSGTRAATLTTGGLNQSPTFAGVIRDGTAATALTKTGTGALTLTGTNTYSGGTTINGGALVLGNGDGTGSLSATTAINTGAVATPGVLAFNRADALTLNNAISGAGGVYQFGSGITTLGGANNTFTGGSGINAGTLDLAAQGAAGTGAITFTGGATSTAQLRLEMGAQNVGGTFGNRLDNFSGSNSLDLRGFAYNGAAGFTVQNSTLTVTGGAGGTQTETFVLRNGATSYVAMSDGAGGTLLRAGTFTQPVQPVQPVQPTQPTNPMQPAAPCYVTGTRIRVLRGRVIADVPVEALRVGDLALTASGRPRPIRWIGTRGYPGLSAPRHDRPVRVRAGALAEGLPARDLSVSPDHCLWLDGLFVAAGHLVNGTSITRGAAVRDLTYWHVELDTHDLLLAEGAPAESFLAAPGVRAGFDGVGEAVDAGAAPAPYAPRIERNDPRLDALRARLILRAGLSNAPTRFGAVRAWLDVCEVGAVGGLRVAGWARDDAHPDAPVCLDILVDGEIVALALAQDHRADLAAAGMGEGRCGFDLALDVALAPGVAHVVEVRRSADGLRVAAMAVDAAGTWTALLAA